MPSHGPAYDPHNLGLENPWEFLVRDDPDITFDTLRPQYGPRAFQDYWLRNRGRVLQDFNAQTGAAALRGEAPTQDLFDFTRSYPFQARYLDQTPRQRGELGSTFSPRLQYDNRRRR